MSKLQTPDGASPSAAALLGPQGLAADWQALWETFAQSAPAQALAQRLQAAEQSGLPVFPPPAQRFRAFALTPLQKVRTLILGQDPYHTPGLAEGLAFSVPTGQKIPPSLRNIFQELKISLGVVRHQTTLVDWAQQGVLLLNRSLTVAQGQPASHAGWGWEAWTDAVIAAVARKKDPVAFLLWGRAAQSQAQTIAQHNADQRHLVLTANHPSPLSARRGPEPFLGCGHFAQEAAWAKTKGYPALRW